MRKWLDAVSTAIAGDGDPMKIGNVSFSLSACLASFTMSLAEFGQNMPTAASTELCCSVAFKSPGRVAAVVCCGAQLTEFTVDISSL